MIIRILETGTNVATRPQIARVIRVNDHRVPSGITDDVLTAAGSMIVASAASTPSETGAPNADDLVWTSKLDEPLKGSWQAKGGGGGDIDLTNKSGGNLTSGTVVIWDDDNDSAFTTTSTKRDRRVAGVLSEDISNNATGKVAVAGKIVTTKVTGAVSRGMFLIASATTGYAEADGYARPLGALGIALSENASGTGTVSMFVTVDHYLGASAGKGYILGGSNGSAVATAQILTIASETVALSASTNLGAVRSSPSGVGTTDKGFTFGGTTSDYTAAVRTAYKTPFSTDVTAAVTSANLTDDSAGGADVEAPLAGYHAGGMNTFGGYLTTAWKTPWSTETTAAQASANLGAGRVAHGSIYSETNGYYAGGYNSTPAVQVTAYRLVISTETTAALSSANLSAAREGLATVMNTTQGYWSGGTTGSVSTTTDKMPFSTETTAAVGGAALSAARKKSAGASSTSGYVLGGSTVGTIDQFTPSTPVATTDKLNFSSDTMAAASGANLSTSLSGSAYFTG